MFIDIDETIDAVGCYYNFDDVTDEMWEKIDEIVKGEWERRGYGPEDTQEFYDTYVAVLDGAVGYIMNLKKYSVFVGDGEVNDDLVTYDEAASIADEWREKGYDDVCVAFYDD